MSDCRRQNSILPRFIFLVAETNSQADPSSHGVRTCVMRRLGEPRCMESTDTEPSCGSGGTRPCLTSAKTP